jgi:hypothetical protein
LTRNSPYLLKIRVYSVRYPHVKILWSVLILGKMRHTYLNWYHSCIGRLGEETLREGASHGRYFYQISTR